MNLGYSLFACLPTCSCICSFDSTQERLSSASTVSTQPLTDDLAARLDDELPLISLEADGRGGRVAGSPSGSGKDADLHLRSIERGRRDASGSGEVELPNIEFDIDLPPLGDDLPPSARKSAGMDAAVGYLPESSCMLSF